MRQCRDEGLSESGAEVKGPPLKRHRIRLELNQGWQIICSTFTAGTTAPVIIFKSLSFNFKWLLLICSSEFRRCLCKKQKSPCWEKRLASAFSHTPHTVTSSVNIHLAQGKTPSLHSSWSRQKKKKKIQKQSQVSSWTLHELQCTVYNAFIKQKEWKGKLRGQNGFFTASLRCH